MTFSTFSQYLQQLEATSSRLEMTYQLAELFQKLEPQEIPQACYLMQGSLVPSYQSLEFGMSEKLTMRAVAKLLNHLDQDSTLPATNLFNEQDDSLYQKKIEHKNKEIGDLGLTIESLLLAQPTTSKTELSILEVHHKLQDIAQASGDGSQDRKIDQTFQLLLNLPPVAAKFAVRIIIGKLRLGFSTMTMIDALSWVKYQNKSDSDKIEAAYQKKADIGKLAQGYLASPSPAAATHFLTTYQVEVGIPVMPALCQHLNNAEEIIEKMGKVMIEPKYDGLRTQIHVNKLNQANPYQVFTRNLDNVSHMFPELLSAITQINATSCILDAEAIAYNPKTGALLPFQETITRKRKHDIGHQSDKVPLKFFVFDILYLDGKSLIDQKLSARKQILIQMIEPNQTIAVTQGLITGDPKKIHQYHQLQLKNGLEGAVIKKIDATYRSGRKGWRWVKIKESEGTQGKLNDTLDCVVMGYYRGKGKRNQFGIGAFLVGVLAPDNKIKTIAKIGTGLTDDEFKYLKKIADENISSTRPAQYEVPKTLVPDVWIAPHIVVEIAADELTTSPTHTAGKALRFPRLVKFRSDKNWEQATTVSELEEIAM